MEEVQEPEKAKQFQPSSLMEVCGKVIVCSQKQIDVCIALGLPTIVYTHLLGVAVALLNKNAAARNAMISLITSWPQARLTVSKFMPKSISVDTHILEEIMLLSLLQLKSSCRLHTVDFSGENFNSIYLLPVLSLPAEQKNLKFIMSLIHQKCKSIADDPENLESVLKWKLGELAKKNYSFTYAKQGCLELIIDCQLNLTDWMAMDDEVLGLLLQTLSPYRLKIRKLVVNNFHLRNVNYLKWYLSVMQLQEINHFVVYGKRKSITLLMWELHKEMKRMTNLEKFVMGTSGPHIPMLLCGENYPSPEELLNQTVCVFNSWVQLTELYCIGTVLKDKLGAMLRALTTPLKKLQIYACRLSKEDIQSLGISHHLPELTELGLEYNDLQGMGHELADALRCCHKVKLLNLKETNLRLHEKTNILSTLQESFSLTTLALYENEDMISSSAYETVVEMACLIPQLEAFYIFPFNCKPFDIFFRAVVVPKCEEILQKHNRYHMKLYY